MGMRKLHPVCLRLVPLILLCLSGSASAQTEFIRGDANGDGLVEISDVILTFGYLTDHVANPAPLTGCPTNPGELTNESADYNDNEFLTIADPVRVMLSLFGPAPQPTPFPPTTCGTDPTTVFRGFDVVDPGYRVLLAPARVIEGTPRLVQYPIYLDVATDVLAMECYFTPSDLAVVSNPSIIGTTAVEAAPSTALASITVISLTSPSTLVNVASTGVSLLGFLQYELAPGATPPVLSWVPEYFAGFQRRATLVDDTGGDHHPEFVEIDGPLFQRGDCSTGLSGILAEGDGIVDIGDVSYLQHYLWDGAPAPFPDCGDIRTREPMDVNDNEYVTIADALLLEAFVGGSVVTPLPLPDVCGEDPDNDAAGFDARDNAFSLTADDLTIIVSTPTDIRAEINLGVDTPGTVTGLAFTLRLPSGVTPHASLLTLDAGVSATAQIKTILDGDRLMIVVYDYDNTLLSGTGERPLGLLQLALDQPSLASPIRFVRDAQIGPRIVRMTIVDGSYADHHPLTRVGTKSFVRGEINNDSAPDVADPIYLLSFLFQNGAAPPCLDSTDINNDGRIDLADVIFELTFLFAGLGQFPVDPYPHCGFDSDIDQLDCQLQAQCP